MASITMQHYDNEPDSLTTVEYDDVLDAEVRRGKNQFLEFSISSHYRVAIQLHFNSRDFGGEYYFTIDSEGDGGCKSTIARNRDVALEHAQQAYGAPHTEEFRALVDRLLISQSNIDKLIS